MPDDPAGPGAGTVELRVSTENDEPALPEPAPAAACAQPVEQTPAVRAAILAAVFDWCQRDYLTRGKRL